MNQLNIYESENTHQNMTINIDESSYNNQSISTLLITLR